MVFKKKEIVKESTRDLIKQRALEDLSFFIRLIHPKRMLGACHEELISWMNRQDAKSHQIVLLPRDHMKSTLMAYRVAQALTKNPELRIMYVSSTANLAIKQLKFIKDILTSDKYRYYWPEMVHEKEGDREKWTETEISIDHPKRKLENVRDPSIFAVGLTTNVVGLHCDISVYDDVVVDDNAYSEPRREDVRTRISYFSSIAGTDGKNWIVGTRYHPEDLYQSLQEMVYESYDEDGNVIMSQYLYEVYERAVETHGDGTGEFLWPRMKREDGKWFGFNQEILSKKKAQYSDATKFRAQYYNTPNDVSTATISKDSFQYYNQKKIQNYGGIWFYEQNRLNVFASIDFAFTTGAKSDSTSIVVVGVDAEHNYYVLAIDRFKTDKISEYYKRILALHSRWKFKKLIAEISIAQSIIVKDLKENYIKPNGLVLSIIEHKPTSRDGSKEERIETALQPRYSNGQMWHYRGGNCEILEMELLAKKPPHDDVKDALASCVEYAIAPSRSISGFFHKGTTFGGQSNGDDFRTSLTHSRFGGI